MRKIIITETQAKRLINKVVTEQSGEKEIPTPINSSKKKKND